MIIINELLSLGKLNYYYKMNFSFFPGIVGGVEETLALNALVVYWNPLESPAKVTNISFKLV